MTWKPPAIDVVDDLLAKIAREPRPDHPENVLPIKEEIAQMFSTLSNSGQLGDPEDSPELQAMHPCDADDNSPIHEDPLHYRR